MTALALTSSAPLAVQEKPALTLTTAEQRWIPITRVVELMKENEGTIRRRCQDEWSGQGRARKMKDASGRTMWHVDVTVNDVLMRSHVIGNAGPEKSPMAMLLDLPKKQRDLAMTRAAALSRFRLWRLRDDVHTVKDYPAFAASIQEEFGIKVSRRQMYEWNSTAPNGDDARHIACALIDKRGGVAVSRISNEAWAMFLKLYLTGNRWSIAKCYRVLLVQAAKHNWSVPSQRRIEQLIKERVLPATIVLKREGEAAHAAKFLASMQQHREAWAAGELWETDHARLNLFCRRISGGKLVGHRPWITSWIDWRSRRVMACLVSWTPCGDTIRHSLLEAIRTSPVGPPKFARMDNGKDFKQKAHTGLTKREMREISHKGGYFLDDTTRVGLFPLLNIQEQFGTPYNPNSKARIERWHRWIQEDNDKEFEAWSGAHPGDRDPDELSSVLAQTRNLPELSDVQAKIDEWVRASNLRIDHSIEDLIDEDTGRKLSPEEFLIQKAPERRRLPDPDVLKLLMPCWSQPRKVTKHGISVRIEGVTFRFGDTTPELERFKHSGEMVYTSEHEGGVAIEVYSSSLEWICTAPRNPEFGGTRLNSTPALGWKLAKKKKREQKKLAEQSYDLCTAILPEAELAAREYREHVIREGEARMAAAEPLTSPIKLAPTRLDGVAGRMERKKKLDAPRALLALPADDAPDVDVIDISNYVGADHDDDGDQVEEFSIHAYGSATNERADSDTDEPVTLAFPMNADAPDDPDILERLNR